MEPFISKSEVNQRTLIFEEPGGDYNISFMYDKGNSTLLIEFQEELASAGVSLPEHQQKDLLDWLEDSIHTTGGEDDE